MEKEVRQIIENFNMKPHPEGGYYTENYRSKIFVAEKNLPESFPGRRSISTSIMYLLPQGTFSSFHRLIQDEIWYYHAGEGPEIHCIFSDHSYKKIKMGTGIVKEEYPQVIIPAGTFFAASAPANFAFCGCVVTPGFDFADLDMPGASQLIKMFPEHEKLIRKYSRS
jgi:predicted cupin superfamily sugar epimerase